MISSEGRQRGNQKRRSDEGTKRPAAAGKLHGGAHEEGDQATRQPGNEAIKSDEATKARSDPPRRVNCAAERTRKATRQRDNRPKIPSPNPSLRGRGVPQQPRLGGSLALPKPRLGLSLALPEQRLGGSLAIPEPRLGGRLARPEPRLGQSLARPRRRLTPDPAPNWPAGKGTGPPCGPPGRWSPGGECWNGDRRRHRRPARSRGSPGRDA